MMRIQRLFAVGVALALVLVACADSDDTVDTDSTASSTTKPSTDPSTGEPPVAPGSSPEFEELQAARTTWSAAGIGDYDYVFTTSCECLEEISGPNVVKVRNGAVVSVTHNGIGVDRPARTVEQYFVDIENALARGVDIDVTYDDSSGRPVRVYLDTAAMAADGGDGTELIEFTSLRSFRSQLDKAQDTWVANGSPTYEITHVRRCFCVAETRIVSVIDGMFASMTTPEGLAPVDRDGPLTVFEMFGAIEDAFDRGAASITVDYHPELGYPTEYFIDDSTAIADEETGMEVLSLDAG